MEKKNNLFALISMCLALANIVFLFVLGNVISVTNVYLVCLVSSFGAAVLGIVGLVQIKKDETQKGKGMAITGLVLGLLGVAFFGLAYIGFKNMDNPEFTKTLCVNESMVNECTLNGDETATCKYYNMMDITCYASELKDSQYK